MTLTFKKITSTLALNLAVILVGTALGGLSQPSFSMDMDTCQTIAQDASPLNKGALSLETQKILTIKGHELLNQIYSNEPVDLLNSTLHSDLFFQFEKEFYGNQYSYVADYAPTNLFRWYWSSTDESYNTQRKNQMMGIVAITWALAALAEKQGDCFERGSFTIKDPGHCLYNFFLDYVKLTTGFQDPQTVPYALTTCNFAYRRDPSLHGSSHHKVHCPQSQFGVDIRFAPTEGILKLCPYDTTHLLFAMLDIGGQNEPLLFVKWEDLGMGSLGAAVSHSLGFMHSQKNVADEARREKDIKADILSSFEKMQALAGIEGTFKTIRSMVLKASELKTQDIMVTNALVHDSAVEFLTLVDTHYPNGNNHLRCGNEVVLELGRK